MPTTSGQPFGADPTTRQLTIPAWVVVVPLRLFLVAGWARAAAEKLIDDRWWSGDEVRAFLVGERANALTFMRPLMEGVFSSQAQLVAVIVVLGQIAIALSIASGWFIRQGLWAAVVLNVVFITCGRVNPSAFYLVMELALLFVLSEASRPSRRDRPLWWMTVTLTALAAAAFLVPFIDSVRPAALVGDPAAMLAFIALLTAAVAGIRWGQLERTGAVGRFSVAMVAWASGTEHRAPVAVVRAALPDLPEHPLPDPPAGTAVAAVAEVADVAEEPVARVAG